ncbi:ferritin-like domain-containing protein [Stutzerimonas stutzeri]|uniref:ferritin-like domain-containing protein n=1 Tax=Stutzerimonas stutzeri TaxID=316 RepID=UPI00244A52D1|nr:ferritin family protein [Stutzerimonas stutzeri]MDH0425447.1 ferritin family protein [Stutzerimonas stutzeri]
MFRAADRIDRRGVRPVSHSPFRPERSVEELLAHALAIEREAFERYSELVVVMETHRDFATADLFQRMANGEKEHVAALQRLVGDRELPRIAPWEYAWYVEGPETIRHQDLEYRMPPRRALLLALEAERGAAAFYEQVVSAARTTEVKSLAERMLKEEREHVELLSQWLEMPAYACDEAPPEDPDPPVLID